MGQNNTRSEFSWSAAIVGGVVCLIVFAAIGGAVAQKTDQGPTEAQAEANRKRLLLVPIQTEGVMPQPVEIPEVPDPALTITIKIEKSAEFKCPHCGKPIKVKVE